MQLQHGDPEDDGRGALEGVGPAPTASSGATTSTSAASTKSCNDVMKKELRDWLEKHGIHGPPPSPEAEQRAMWQWIRDFHKEYSDDWFARNMARMLEVFRPVFLEEMKKMKAAARKEKEAAQAAVAGTAATSAASAAKDLLDLDASAPAVASTAKPPTQANGAADLLGFDDAAAPAPGPGAAPQQANLLAGGDLLLDVGSTPAYTAAPTAAAAPAPAPAAGAGLLDLGVLDPATAPAATAPQQGGYGGGVVPAAAASVAVAPAVQAARKDPLMDLLDM